MATYSTSLQIKLITDGTESGTWGNSTNTNWNLIEQAVAGVQSITMINADYTLTVVNGGSDEARNAVLMVSGTNSAIRKIVIPAVTKTYIVYNNTTGGYAITIGTSGGSVVTVPNGVATLVFCDATNTYTGISGSSGNFTVPGNESVSGNSTITGNLSVGGTTTLTGNATAPTQSSSDSSTKVATTAFVRGIIPTGIISLWYGSIASVPSGWYLCDGSNGTPDLRDRFIVGAGSTYAVAATGGSATVTPAGTISGTVGGTALTSAQMPKHYHQMIGPNSVSGGSYPIQNDQGTGSFGNFGGGTPDDAAQSYGTFSTGGSATSGSYSTGTANGDSHDHSFSGTFTGTSGTNLPPYYALAYIMKA